MFRSAFRPLSFLHCTRSAFTARYFHRVTTDFVTHDASGNLVTSKVPIIIGNPGETYVLIEQGVGSALRAASPYLSASAASAEERCKLTFFHDSQYFGFGKLSVHESFLPPRLITLCFIARTIELSPPLCPKPNAPPNRVRFKFCNFVSGWKDARDSSRWNT